MTTLLPLRRLIARLQEDRWSGSVYVRESALSARDMALDSNDRLLLAEAKLLLGRTFKPMVFPAEAYDLVTRAAQIFEANDLEGKVAQCQVVAARALFDMGQDRDAIASAHAALESASLPAEYRAAAFVVSAMCHGHLGETRRALKLILEHAAPLSEQPGAHWVRPHVLRAAAALRMQVFIARQAPEFSRSLPNVTATRGERPTAAEIAGLVAAAREAMPSGRVWELIELTPLWLAGLMTSSADSVAALEDIASRSDKPDPPLACAALFCKAAILRRRGDLKEALNCVDKALALALRWELPLARVDLLLEKARTLESLGNVAASLDTYKAFWELRIRSTTQNIPATDHDAASDASSASEDPDEESGRLRNPAPDFIEKAVLHIEQNLKHKLRVDDVATHCQVGRRTLEIAFKNARDATVAQYIKQRRLERAAQALQTTNRSVREVSQDMGYRTQAAFARDFLARFGSQPSSWRRLSSKVR